MDGSWECTDEHSTKGGLRIWGLGMGVLITYHTKTQACYTMLHRASLGFGRILWFRIGYSGGLL
jgi:hypothetical protein